MEQMVQFLTKPTNTNKTTNRKSPIHSLNHEHSISCVTTTACVQLSEVATCIDEVKPRDKSALASAEKRSTEGKPGTDGHSVTLTCNINYSQIVLPTALVK
ncbi:hypothetical protein CBL_12090, partial [Carabus blaptoides fortunei]